MVLRVTGATGTHTGCVRLLNEDGFCTRPEIGLWAVADGMGGHDHGERASAAIVARLEGMPLADSFNGQIEAIAEAIHAANIAIFDEGQADGSGMGTTIVALLIGEERFGIVWAGDSRAYLFRDERLHQLSTDHTQVQELVDRGLITPMEARGHPMAHVLARAVGVADQLELDVVVDAVAAGDRFLICSDGLTGVLTDQEIAYAMQSVDCARLPAELIANCLDRGAPDNVTICVAEVREATQLVVAEGPDDA